MVLQPAYLHTGYRTAVDSIFFLFVSGLRAFSLCCAFFVFVFCTVNVIPFGGARHRY